MIQSPTRSRATLLAAFRACAGTRHSEWRQGQARLATFLSTPGPNRLGIIVPFESVAAGERRRLLSGSSRQPSVLSLSLQASLQLGYALGQLLPVRGVQIGLLVRHRSRRLLASPPRRRRFRLLLGLKVGRGFGPLLLHLGLNAGALLRSAADDLRVAARRFHDVLRPLHLALALPHLLHRLPVQFMLPLVVGLFALVLEDFFQLDVLRCDVIVLEERAAIG